VQKHILVVFFTLAVIAFSVGIWHSFKVTAAHQGESSKEVTLLVYAPTSFVDSYGPGDEIKKLFEAQCGCTVVYVDVGGARAALDRLELDSTKHVDVVLGLDLLLLRGAATRVKFQEVLEPKYPSVPELKDYHYQRFTPYDWSPMGFVYNTKDSKIGSRDITEIKSWADAFKLWPEKSIALEDPSLSTPGLEWLFWLYRTQPDIEGGLKALAHATYTVTPTWSAAYGLFKNHQVKSTFSYLTSLIYHWHVEKNHDYQFLAFDEGQPLQIEFAAVPDVCWSCDIGKNFVLFLTSPPIQKIIAEKNYMRPVTANVEVAPEFGELPKVKLLSAEKLDDFVKDQSHLIELWKHAQ
jgi:thiamine transport system substrate-binding protein